MQAQTELNYGILDKLINLGVDSNLIKTSQMNVHQAAQLYHSFQRILSSINFLAIQQRWQLHALSGDVTLYSQIDHNLHDSHHATPTHYAAWSGNLTALKWANKHYPKSLTQLDNINRTIAHYASCCSGNSNSLNWISKHYPNLLIQVDSNGETIAHYAAKFENTDILEWVKNNHPELLSQLDNEGENIAHYAAERGKLDILEWIKNSKPELLTQISKNKKNIVYYAVESENIIEILEWVKNYNPKLLVELDNCRTTIAHAAAIIGNKTILAWTKEYYPELLTRTDAQDMTIADYAAYFNHQDILSWINEYYPALLGEHNNNKLIISLVLTPEYEAILWVKEHRPELLTQPNKEGLTLTQQIARSGNPARLNQVLRLINNPRTFEVPKIHAIALKGLQEALKTNYFLLNVTYQGKEEELDQAVLQQINQQLARNQAILDAMPVFCFLLSGHFQQYSSLALLPLEIVMIILHHYLPPGVNLQATSKLLNEALPYVEPLAHHIKFIIHSINQERVKLNNPTFFGKYSQLLNPIKQPQKQELQALEDVISQKVESFDTLKSNIKTWQQSVQSNHSTAYNFFSQKQDFMLKITNIVNLPTV